MKIGADNKKQLYWMIALLAIAIPLAVYNFSGVFGTSAAAPPSPAAATSPAAPKRPVSVQEPPNTLDPTLHVDLLDASRKVKYESGGRNIFRMEEAPIPKPIAPPRPENAPPPTPTPLPPPPQIPLKFYGFASKANEPKRIFLEESGSVFIAKQGDIVDRRYKVVQIMNTSVVIEDVLTANRQTIALTAR